jgi:hypothetical protein
VPFDAVDRVTMASEAQVWLVYPRNKKLHVLTAEGVIIHTDKIPLSSVGLDIEIDLTPIWDLI